MADTMVLPLLPLKNSVLFPFALMPLAAGRPQSLASLEAASKGEEKLIAVFTQRDPDVEDPKLEDLSQFGTKAVIRRMSRSDGVVQALVQGLERIEVVALDLSATYPAATVRSAPLPPDPSPEAIALQRELLELAASIQDLAGAEPRIDFAELATQLDDPGQIVYLLASVVGVESAKAIGILEAPTRLEAMRLLHDELIREKQVAEVRQKINKQASSEMNKEQREYLLRQQLRAINEELGEKSPEQAEVVQLRKRLDEIKLPEDVRQEAERELKRLESTPAVAPDFQVTRGHLELLIELPWNEVTTDNLDLNSARVVLDEDHYGLNDIKERILEHLAVMKLNPEAHAPILCFVGPPGVGKTSLGQSIARALGRKFERFSLGGLHDEAELRGHRRTYVGAMPGRVLQALRRAKVKNPLLMLDEVDKLGSDYRGDPAAALLEILDPAQNSTFRDNYLDLPFDLSKVFFVTTANTTDTIPRPLLDRMELIRLTGYSDEEKLEIAKRFLLTRRRKDAGLSPEQLIVPDETLLAIIRRYTRESGVRELERTLGRLARKVALRIAQGDASQVILQPSELKPFLGTERFFQELARKTLPPGVATGLAWTETGGDVLYVEAVLLPESDRSDRFMLTGQLGRVMQESAQAARSYIVSHFASLGIEPSSGGVHVHVPAGAIPKDGPSAGVTMATALASLYSGLPVRNDTAMTGEITLTGMVLPVGGIKEKVLAARRAGLKCVILPKENARDIAELAEEVQRSMRFDYAERIEDVLSVAIPQLAERLAPVPVQ
ncbi:MAG TPA: endopeptidase La [Planctomycetaceae bacterium]|jgi:ATP-dependent Lon protease|nr:endopeptidase La [Planctomycetaceae bacterium]